MERPGEAFVSYLRHNLPLVEQSIRARTPAAAAGTAQAPDLERYLYGPVRRFVSSGGKRVRPVLCLLGAQAVGADPQMALPVAAAVELFQSAALIHDDIADDGELRRGEPCLHVAEGTGLAINAGDAALVAVTAGIAREQALSARLRLSVLDEMCTMMERTLDGQALDLGWARDGRWDVSVDDYLAMARCKTAYYSAAVPLVLGALCGGGTSAQVEGMRSFGMRAGLAFQIQDDLLNLVGDAQAQGKDFRSDITEGKRTLVMVYAQAHLSDDERAELVRILSARTADPAQLARAVRLADAAGALSYARGYAQKLVSAAKSELSGLDIAPDMRPVLRSMADFFVERAG